MKTKYTVFFLLFCSLFAGNVWGQTAFTITYTGLGGAGTTGAVANPSTLFTVALTNSTAYNGVDATCSSTGDGITSYVTTIAAKAGYNFTITSITGTAYASSAGLKGYQFQISSSNANFTTATSTVTSIGTSSSCSGSGTIGSLTGSFVTTAGNSCTINVTKSKTGSESGGGYSKTRTLVISGTYTAVVAGATKLALVSTPSTGTINTNLASFTVEARKADNSVDNTYTSNITIAKATGTGTLSGTVTKAAVNGVATFNDLKFNAAGTYTISAASSGLTGATSGNIVISDVSAATDYFRSKQNGNWNAAATWESSHDNSTWFAATLVPTENATNTIINHIVTATADITIGNTTITTAGDTLKIAPAVAITVPTGKVVTINANAGLVFQSTSLGTARMANSAGSINGTVTVERFITGGQRAFRFIGHPFSTSTALSQYANDLDITGAAGTFAGFTNDVNLNPSSFYYDPIYGNESTTADLGWKAYTAATQTIEPGNGFRLFVRGKKAQAGIFTLPYATPQDVTISVSGTLNPTGNFVKNLVLGDTSGYNMVSNPYISPIDVTTVSTTAGVNNNFWIWDSRMGTAGAYLTYTFGTGGYALPSSGSFFVRTTAASESITFKESDKVSTDTTMMLRQMDTKQLLVLNITSDNKLYDRFTMFFDKKSTPLMDNILDGTKFRNSDLSFYSITADHKELAVDVRPLDADMIVPIGITSKTAKPYSIVVSNLNIGNDYELYLKDKYLGTETKLSAGMQYDFVVTADAASQGENRFELVTRTSKQTIAIVNGLTVELSPNPATDVVKVSFSNATAEATTITILNEAGVVVKNINCGKVSNGQQTIPVKQFAKGIYIVQLVSGKETKAIKFIIQ